MASPAPRSYRECAELLGAVINRFVEIKTRMGYSEKDARGKALEEYRAIGNCSFMIVNILLTAEEGRVDFRKLVGIQTGDVELARDILDESARIYLVMSFQFKLETLWKNLIRELGTTNPRQGYHNTLEDLFRMVPVSDPNRSKFNTLHVLALVRNSLHSNGTHYGYKGASYHIEIDGLMFDFEHGALVQCAGWWHIIHALNGAVGVIDGILNTPAIKALPDPVFNDFSPD